MPSYKTITPILGGNYYHIFNRGVNKDRLFFKEANYDYFLMLLSKFLSPYVRFLAYCLIPNHFHLAVKIRDEVSINGKTVTEEIEIGDIVTKQLKKLFITYAMAINIQENRGGSLFNPKFKRIEITDHEYLKQVIFYIHLNPLKHNLTGDFTRYRYSSFIALKGNNKTNLDKEYVYEIFDNKEGFLDYHKNWHDEKEKLIVE